VGGLKKNHVTNFLKLHYFQFKSAHLLKSSPQGERMKVRGRYLDPTLTPTLSRLRERGND
jgi:hypothetical protein